MPLNGGTGPWRSGPGARPFPPFPADRGPREATPPARASFPGPGGGIPGSPDPGARDPGVPLRHGHPGRSEGPRGDRPRGAHRRLPPPRHREAGDSRDHSPQERPPHRRRVREGPAPSRQRPRDPGPPHRRCSHPGGHRVASRAVGRKRVPGRPRRRGHPAVGADRGDRRCAGCHDLAAGVPGRAGMGGCRAADPGALRLALRSRPRPSPSGAPFRR
jgi:hypothetical protein